MGPAKERVHGGLSGMMQAVLRLRQVSHGRLFRLLGVRAWPNSLEMVYFRGLSAAFDMMAWRYVGELRGSPKASAKGAGQSLRSGKSRVTLTSTKSTFRIAPDSDIG